MRNLIICLIWFGTVIAPNHLNAQAQQKQFRHRIALQTGLFHYFFDESPVLNINYRAKVRPDLFNALFLNSLGITYTFCLNEKSNLTVEYSYFSEIYLKYHNTFEDHPVVGSRYFKTFGLLYTREKDISKRFTFLYGAGLNYRTGNEMVILGGQGPGSYELIVDVIQRRDVGLNAFTGVNFKISRRFYCYSKVDLLSFVYFGDKKQKEKFEDIYKAPQFPTRFDLSLKFGIGVKF